MYHLFSLLSSQNISGLQNKLENAERGRDIVVLIEIKRAKLNHVPGFIQPNKRSGGAIQTWNLPGSNIYRHISQGTGLVPAFYCSRRHVWRVYVPPFFSTAAFAEIMNLWLSGVKRI